MKSETVFSLRTLQSFINCEVNLLALNMAETYFITGAQGCIGSWIETGEYIDKSTRTNVHVD